jgi:Asp-tRNA(Asn)/Glu-tRNA(Gln) amidotransferase A subunit family amidase
MSDQAGPLCRTVEDCSTVSTILAGYDPNDPISLPYPVPDYKSYLSGTLTQLKVGIPVDRWLWNWESEEVENIVRTAISCLSNLGAELIPINLPRNEEGWDAHFKITLPELACYYQDNFSASELEQWPEISGRITAGKNQTFSDYYRAQQVADGIRQEVALAFQSVDLIVMPTGANVGVRGDAETMIIRGQEVSTTSKAVHINNIAAMTGCPAISVPCGFTFQNKLPVGLQIIGRRFAEATVLQAAFAYEQANQWYKEHPKLR